MFTECKKDDKKYKVFFWGGRDMQGKTLTLFINDVNEGALPFIKDKVTCDNDSSKQKALLRELGTNRFNIKVRDDNGLIFTSGTLNIGKNSIGVDAGTSDFGTIEAESTGDCITVGLK